MTSSSEVPAESGIDTMLLIYSLLEGHPASDVCEQFLRSRTGWFTTVLTLLEVRAVLTKVYGVESTRASDKIGQLAHGPMIVFGLDITGTVATLHLADSLRIDLSDAALIYAAQAHGISRLATDDAGLARACVSLGIIVDNPIDSGLRTHIAEWERANLPPKGLVRILSQVHVWLMRHHPEAAEDFWSQTGTGS